MERAVALCPADVITLDHLPLEKMGTGRDMLVTQVPAQPPNTTAALLASLPTLTDPTKLAERTRIVEALVAENWNQTRAAKRLDMPRRTFVSKLDQYGIPRPQKGRESPDGGSGYSDGSAGRPG